jgi:hypothetical protein
MAIEAELPDGRVLEFPDGTDPRVVQATVKRVLGVKEEGGIGTVGGFFRGIPAGGVNLLESAAIGASAVLPESLEKPVREGIRSTAEAARRPFAGQPGEESTISRRFGESVGSFVPLVPLGALGVAGRLGAMGVGVASGAGEARVRAEEGGATEGQRAGATGLGAAVGFTEVLPVFAFLNRLGADGAGVMNILRRAAVTGGQEGLQEAAANVAQNLISKGLYNPEQGVFTDTGEALGYGAGTGALVSALTDLVLGRRSRGATQEPPEPTEAPAPEGAPPLLPAPEGPAGLLPAPETPTPKDPAAMSVGELYQEEGRLSALPKEGLRQPENAARLREVRDLKKQFNISDAEDAVLQVEARKAQEAKDRAFAEQSAFGQPELPEVTPREGFVAPTPITRELLAEAGLPLEPKTPQQRGVAEWFDKNVVGRTMEEIKELIEKTPDLIKGNALRARILREFDTVTPMPFEESAIGRPADTALPEPLGPELGGSEPSVELPSAGSPVGGELGAAGAPATPVGAGVGPAELPAAQGAVPERSEPLALTEPVPAAQARAPSTSEPPLKPGLSPEREQALRAQLADMRAEIAQITQAQSLAERELSIGELTGDEAAQSRAATALKDLRATEKSLMRKSDRAYWQLYDSEQADQQAEVGQRLFDEDAAARAAREQTSVEERTSRKGQGLYPYNLKTAEAVHEELRDQVSQTPEYKRIIEKYLTPDRRLKNPANEAAFIEEGQKLLDEKVLYQGDSATGVPLSPEVLNELNTNGVADALNLLATTTDNPLYAALARRLSRLLGNTKVNIVDDLRNTEGKPAAGAASTSGRDIWLDRVRGLNEETFLHESVHAASEMVLATPAGKRTAVQNVAVKELNSLWDAAKADPDIKLGTDARESLSEFVTEALTNPKLIKDLKAKPWTLGSVWDQFKRTLLKMLGVKVPANMQEAAVAAMDTIFEPPSLRRDAQGKLLFQLAPNVEAALKSQDTRQPKTLGAAIKGAFGGVGQPGAMNKDVVATESKIRTRLADKAATVFDEINAAVNKGMISAMEAKTVQTLFKQAEAADQLIPEFLRRGALKLNTKLGLWQVADGKNAPVKAIEMVEAWGKKNGLKFDDAWDYAARLIESGRQHEFRRLNALAKPGETKFPLTKDFPIDTLYAAYKADKDLLALKDILDDSRKQLIDDMVSVGRLSKKEGAEWKLAAEYVPFDRLEQFGDKLRQQKRTGRGIAALGKLPELIDAAVVDRPVGNALENYFKTLGWMVEQTVRTDALNKTLSQLEKIGQAQYRGMNRGAIQNKSMAVRAFRNGDEIWYEVPTIYHAAAFNASVGPLPKFLEIFGTISRVLRTSITAIPTFTASQLPQDIQRAIAYSGVKNPAMLTARALSNFKLLGKHALKGTLYEGAPIQSEFGVVGDVDFNRKDPARSILEELGFADRKLLGSKKAGTILHRLNELARASDIAIRKSIYEQTMAETGDQLLALQRAREIINFRTTGSGDPLGILPVMIQTVPFFNAYVQGTDVLYRSLTGSQSVSGLARKAALKQFYTVTGALAAGSTVYALMMAGDDEYENMNLDERDRSWILGGGFSLPVPSEIGMIFKAIPERVAEAMIKYGTPDEKAGMTAVTSWFRAAFMEYAGRTVPIPAAAKPVLEAWTGYSFRSGRQLEGMFQEGLDASERINTSTSEFAKEVARFASKALGMEISPIKIDNTLNGYFGTTAAITLAASDSLINPDKADRPLHQMAGLTPFTYDPVGNRRISEFYDLREKVVSAQNTLNTLMKQDINRAREYVERKRPELLAYKAVNATLKELQATRAYKQFLDTPAAAQQMTSEERMLKKREVQAYEQKLAEWTRMARKELDL